MKVTFISTVKTPIEQGMRTISSVLKENGYKTEIIFMKSEEDYYKLYKQKELEQLKNLCKDSGLIGISCASLSSLKTYQIINYLKENLDIPIIFGGIHPTLCPEECLENTDIVCIGEGEGVMLDLANAIKNKKSIKKIKNLWIRDGDKIIKNGVRDLVDDLDELPVPDYDIENHYILDKGKIRKFQSSDLNNKIWYLSGRGCPYGCTYCSNGMVNEIYKGHRKKIVRTNSIDYVIKFIKGLKAKFNLRYVFIDDDSFTVRSFEDLKEFSEKYKKEINLPFKSTVDARTITEEKVKLLVDSGCVHMTMGIQGSENVNKNVYDRNITYENILKAAKILNKYKDKCTVSYDVLLCSPHEENKDLLEVYNLIKEIPKPFRLQVNLLVFFMGTQLYNLGVSNGTIKTLKDSKMDLVCHDRGMHILRTRKNIYLNSVLSLMRGVVVENKYGSLKVGTLDKLIQKKYVNFFSDNKKITLIFPYSLVIFDFIKYEILIKLYRKFPFKLKKAILRAVFGKKILVPDEVIR